MKEQKQDVFRDQVSDDFASMMEQFFSVRCRYEAAVREIRTKLEILDLEFEMKHSRNPIHHMNSRLKSFPSAIDKMKRKGLPVTIANMTEALTDIAGVRVVCSYIDDVYAVAELLTRQDDIRVIRVRDYIKEPKENGYRSLHIIVEIPVFLQQGKTCVPVEVQIRTIAMDMWASLEHQLRYKGLSDVPADISAELQTAADDLASLDRKMESIHQRVSRLPDATV